MTKKKITLEDLAGMFQRQFVDIFSNFNDIKKEVVDLKNDVAEIKKDVLDIKMVQTDHTERLDRIEFKLIGEDRSRISKLEDKMAQVQVILGKKL